MTDDDPMYVLPPAHLAVEHERIDELVALLDDGLDVNLQDAYGMTLLSAAIDVEAQAHSQDGEPLRDTMSLLLLERGADPRIANMRGHSAVWVARHGHPLALANIRRIWGAEVVGDA
jgi:ankyrin repeat protein